MSNNIKDPNYNLRNNLDNGISYIGPFESYCEKVGIEPTAANRVRWLEWQLHLRDTEHCIKCDNIKSDYHICDDCLSNGEEK